MDTDGTKTVSLTERELSIVQLIAQGKTTPQIASGLALTVETVKWYRKRLLSKFSASTSAEVVRKAIEQGIL